MTINIERNNAEPHFRTIRKLAKALDVDPTSLLEEIRDEGWSAAHLERPGLDGGWDLVEAEGVEIVVAQDADRIMRDPGVTGHSWTTNSSGWGRGSWPSTIGATTRTRASC